MKNPLRAEVMLRSLTNSGGAIVRSAVAAIGLFASGAGVILADGNRVMFSADNTRPAASSHAMAESEGRRGSQPFSLMNVYRSGIQSRLSFGLRVTRFSLKHTSRPPDEEREETFLGYINELHEEDATAVWPSVMYRFNDYLACEFTWGEVAARTLNFNSNTSDGVLRMDGLILQGILQYPLQGYLYPYFAVGYAPWKATFDHDYWWRMGWHTPEEYIEAGSPEGGRKNRQRLMVAEDDSGVAYTLGLLVRLHRYIDLDVFVRRMSISSHVRHYRGDPWELQRENTIPLDHTTFGFGIHGVF